MARNPGTRVGRPPKIRSTVAQAPKRGVEPGPMDNYDSATPGAAFSHGGSVNGFRPMPGHHDDPKLCRGGKAK